MNDLISRQAVIDRINKQREHLNQREDFRDIIGDSAYKTCIEFIERLPSAQKTGHWIKKIIPSTLGYYECECSECGRMWQYREGWNYCPNCGAKMMEE